MTIFLLEYHDRIVGRKLKFATTNKKVAKQAMKKNLSLVVRHVFPINSTREAKQLGLI